MSGTTSVAASQVPTTIPGNAPSLTPGAASNDSLDFTKSEHLKLYKAPCFARGTDITRGKPVDY